MLSKIVQTWDSDGGLPHRPGDELVARVYRDWAVSIGHEPSVIVTLDLRTVQAPRCPAGGSRLRTAAGTTIVRSIKGSFSCLLRFAISGIYRGQGPFALG